jgi:ferredoxin
VAKRQEDEVRRNVEEARLNGETTRAREEELRRKAEERTQWEELKDFTNKVERRSSYPDASGGFGDIWKGVLVDDHGRIVQVCTACGTCYRDI